MKTEIRYLQQLETDLGEAAVRHAVTERTEERARAAKSSARGRRRYQVAAILVPLVLVAGTIGGIASLSNRSADDTAGAMATSVPNDPAELPYLGPSEGGGVDIVGGDEGGGGGDGDSGGTPTTNRVGGGDLSKIIRDGSIGVVVANGGFGEAIDRIGQIARANGGFVLSSRIEGNRSGTLVLRIPARQFDRAMETLRGIGIEVESETITGDDVTAEFVDLTARARILTVRRTVLIGLQADANTLEETLRLQGQLDEVQLRIEQIQGQIRFINDQVAEATLRVSLREQDAEAADVDEDVDKPSLGRSVELGVQGFLNVVGFVIVGLGYLVPVGVVLAAVWAVWFLARRSRGRGAGGE